ncbi:MAG: FtsH protease activity modulator HflK [Gammaproteobacteria bacterium]|nr:MAG: FtsH protease activity modulator HflK [Gammaproteobacteria bacterium]
MNTDTQQNNSVNLKHMQKHLMQYTVVVISALLLIYIATGFFYIDPNQIGVQQRFGEIIDADVKPGLHYALPAPIDQITRIDSKNVRSVIVDDFASSGWEFGSRAHRYIKASNLTTYCITGDNNIVNVSLLIKYNVLNPANYIVSTRDVERLIKGFTASSVLKMVSQTEVDEVLTFGKKRIEDGVKQMLQKKLDKFDSGIRIAFVEIREIAPPKQTQRYFDDVINAKQERKKALNVAQAYKNRAIPEAREYANKTEQEANSYKHQQILVAQGEASRFSSQLQSIEADEKLLQKQQYYQFIKQLGNKIDNIRVISPNAAKNN